MKETPVSNIMENTLEKLRSMVDVSTIVGDPIESNGVTIIPVSKVTYGFGSGGSDLPAKTNKEMFGGGGGGGISITPVAFVVIQDGNVKMMQVSHFTSSADRAISMIPELVDKLSQMMSGKDEEEAAEKTEEK